MAKRNLRRFFPFLDWFPLRAENAKADLVAGITCALLAIPQSLAYAQLAGVPAYYGLYAALIPALIGVMFGSSGLLSTGPVAMTSLLTAASISQLAPHGSEQYYAYVILLALVSGVFQVAFGMMRMGVLLNFLSYPVLMGFINAAAIIIGLSQLPAILGIPTAQTTHFLVDIWHVVVNMDSVHEISLILGVAAISLLLAFKKLAPKLPGVLITVAILTTVSYLIGYEKMGGRIVGEIRFQRAAPRLEFDHCAASGRLRDRADQLHGSDVEQQSDCAQDAHAVGRKPGVDRPGTRKNRSSIQPVDAGQRLVLAFCA